MPDALTSTACGALAAVWVVMTDLRTWRFLRVELVEKSVYLSRPCQDMDVVLLPGSKAASKDGIGMVSGCSASAQAGFYFVRHGYRVTLRPQHAV